MSFLASLRRFDAYSKPNDPDVVQVRTTSGATVSIVSAIIMCVLFISEFRYFMHTEISNHLVVDTTRNEQETFPIRVDFTLLAKTCHDVDLELQDPKGRELHDAQINVKKTSYNGDVPVPDDDPAANACRIQANMVAPKMAGSFHVTSGRAIKRGDSHHHALDLRDMTTYNASHTINFLEFGPLKVPGQKSPLDGLTRTSTEGPMAYEYYLQLVTTDYTNLSGKTQRTHQYSATEFEQPAGLRGFSMVSPGLFFKYDFAPLRVQLTETRQSFLRFFTSVCAIVGGVFTVSGMVNAAVYNSAKMLAKTK